MPTELTVDVTDAVGVGEPLHTGRATHAHMHNMASTREQLWERLQSWGDGVAAAR